MPGTNAPQQRAEHRTHTTARAVLDPDGTEDFPRPAEQLTLAAEHVQSSDRTTQQPPDLTRAVVQAAGHRAAFAHTLHIPGDPHPEYQQHTPDRLPHTARTALITAAARRVAPVPNDAPAPTGHAAEKRRRPPARRGGTWVQGVVATPLGFRW
ncbi:MULTISPECIES: hypothetical protein [Streptomyces]|uniref:hypothetical protein n=1 Tax=Streptomyces TaxID=1883 RepID=UPI000ACBD046|nr:MULTISPECIES: hypothetical protein [Streptomyces]